MTKSMLAWWAFNEDNQDLLSLEVKEILIIQVQQFVQSHYRTEPYRNRISKVKFNCGVGNKICFIWCSNGAVTHKNTVYKVLRNPALLINTGAAKIIR